MPDITGNVYHLVLDSMRTDVFLEALERTGLAPEFAGFELFRNNVSNYVTTVPVVGQLLHRHVLPRRRGGRPGSSSGTARASSPRWASAATRSGCTRRSRYWHTRHVDRFWYNFDILEQEEGIVADVGFHGLIQIWLVSLAPNPLTNEALPLAARAARPDLRPADRRRREPLTVPELHPVAGVSMLRRLLREEALRGASGQYVYAHAALPHTPFVFEPDCRYVGQPRPRPQPPAEDPYLQQAQCTIRLVADFLAHLRARGRYDAATVIVHADTGLGIGKVGKGPPPPGKSTLGVADRALLQRHPGAADDQAAAGRGPLQILGQCRTQLVDLFPTVLDILDLEPGYPVDGRSVYTLAPGAPRDVRFGLDPTRKYGHEFVEVRIDDPSQPRGARRSP